MRLASRTDRDDLIVVRQIYLLHRHLDTEHLGLERYFEALFEHGVEAHCLLGFVVSIDRCLLDERIELGFRHFRDARLLVAGAWSPRSLHHLKLVHLSSRCRSSSVRCSRESDRNI